MKKLTLKIIHLFHGQGFVIVSTLDADGKIHCSAKGIAGIKKKGEIYLIDLYQGKTFDNLKRNPVVSITAIDESKFTGYTLKGIAEIVDRKKIKNDISLNWENKVIQRVSKRVIDDIKKEKKSSYHPEALFPQPRYLIRMVVEDIVDLTPTHLKFAHLRGGQIKNTNQI